MKENIHPPYNLILRPDLGGTSCDFVKDIGRDTISFYQRVGARTTKLEIPSNRSFLSLSLFEGLNGPFFEAFYDFTGELNSARLTFTRYCEQEDFDEKAMPSDDIWRTYWRLKDEGEDLTLDVDMNSRKIFTYHGQYLDNGNLKIRSMATFPLTDDGISFLNVVPTDQDPFIPVEFSVIMRDRGSIVGLGIVTNERGVAQDSISTFALPKDLSVKSTPKDITRYLDKVFIEVK